MNKERKRVCCNCGNCTVCPFFHLCMFVEFPEEDIRKWLESEVETDV